MAVQTVGKHNKPHRVCLAAIPHQSTAVETVCRQRMARPLTVVSDALACLNAAQRAGVHEPIVTGGGSASAKDHRFHGVNTQSSQGHEMLFDAHSRALRDAVCHPEHDQFSVAEMLEHERPHLMPMPEPFDGYVENLARVRSTCLATLARNRYSVPCELAAQMLSTRLYPGQVVVLADDRVVARHERLSDRGQTKYPWSRRGHCVTCAALHPAGRAQARRTAQRRPVRRSPKPLQQLRRALLRDPGGDRVMAQVLSIVPTAGLDAVLVAEELALEGAPRGRVGPEHVLNVVVRLNAAPAPQNAATALQVADKPLANTERHDSLRGQASTEEVDHA